MKKNFSATDEQINYFIDFIDKVVKKGGSPGLTMENKLELRSAFRTLVATAQSEILAKVAAKLKELHESIK